MAALAERDIVLLDAPVSGSLSGASEGKPTIIVSGPGELHVKPGFRLAWLASRYRGRSTGSWLDYEAGHQLSIGECARAASAEAMVIGVKAGLDPERMWKCLITGLAEPPRPAIELQTMYLREYSTTLREAGLKAHPHAPSG
ncbi:NAD(P)-binding domain-containing protein [Bradyrhizobium pachyrhizi]|uniref:NAD(P)-binding domain-containing protein n=1 Tax=Bradyrhizobium pachyrhizi TaxID=280333 RepID=UPI0013649BED